MIELAGVTKRYGRKGAAPDALSDVSLAIPRGSVWAVVGPNGAGKSSLLSLILGFIRPTHGTVTVSGASPREYLRDHGAGYLPERFDLPESWRTRDALALFGRLDGVEEQAVVDATALLGLDAFLDKRVGELSRGMLQRLGLAQAVLAGRELIVLDEPTEGLDPIWRIAFRDIITGLRDDARTMIVASHDLGEIERIADRAVVLEDGAVRDVLDVREQGEPAEYHITLATPFDAMASAFPGVAPVEGAASTEYMVRVASAAELSERLGALIALGAVVAAVEPVRAGLEARVRDTLEGGA